MLITPKGWKGENIEYRYNYIFYIKYLHKRQIVFPAHLNNHGIKMNYNHYAYAIDFLKS